MRRFANFYIVLFLVDAGLSLVDELLVAVSSPLPIFSGVRFFVAYLVIALSMVVYACLGIDRRLPKRVFLPLTIYVSWCTLALWPLSGVIARESLGVLSSVGQLLIGGLVIVMLRGLGGHHLLTREHFQTPLFSLRNTLGFTAINLLLLPFALVYTGLATASYYFEQQTAGFLRLSPVGIYMSERTYHLDEKNVRLAGMMHIGREDYYEDLANSMPAAGTIILTEGVTDQDRLLESQLDYNKLADVIGLTSQEQMKIDGNLIDLDDIDLISAKVGAQDKPDIARADIDLNRFDPKTIEFLNVLGRTILSGKPWLEALAEYNVWVDENMTTEGIAGVMADILDKRNKVVIDSMIRSLVRYDTIIIPWGAMHMPAIEAAVVDRGFIPGDKRERLSLDFRTLPYVKLWQKFQSSLAAEKNYAETSKQASDSQ
jgi:hypothetical protein